jgi:hypothetical protein
MPLLHGRLPRPLYVAKPWLLMAAGVALAVAAGGIARGCGGVLACAGVAILARRLR